MTRLGAPREDAGTEAPPPRLMATFAIITHVGSRPTFSMHVPELPEELSRSASLSFAGLYLALFATVHVSNSARDAYAVRYGRLLVQRRVPIGHRVTMSRIVARDYRFQDDEVGM